MKDLISIAILVATIFGGTVAAKKIYSSVRQAALTKAAQGLPALSPFAAKLTGRQKQPISESNPSRAGRNDQIK